MAFSRLVARYRVLPALSGRAFLPIAFLARLPASMTQIGTVVLVSTAFGSIGAGGLAAGFLAAGSAVGGPVIGALSGRFGQRAVVAGASLINAATTLAIVALVVGGRPMALVCTAALACGASTPQIGPLVRTRWAALTGGGTDLSTAMSYEGAADETTFVLGPAVVSLLAAIASPAWSMVAAAVMVGTFGTAVALHHTAQAVPLAGHPRRTGGRRWLTRQVIGLIAAAMTIGCFFGAMQTGVTGIARQSGVAGAAGAIYAVMGIGSAIAGLASAALPARFSLGARLWIFAAAMAVLSLPLQLAGGVPALIAAMIPLGCMVGPFIITLYSLGERESPSERTALVLTLLASGLVVGYSVGSSLGGHLADAVSPSAAFAVATLAMTAGTVLALVLRAGERLRGRGAAVAPEPQPVAA